MRVALLHYWIVNWRGGERVLRAFADLYPEADIFCHVADPGLVADHLPGRTLHTTFIGRLPFSRRHYQKYLPLMPMALEQLDLRNYDLVISSESGPAKGVIVGPDAMHVCYCHSPMRYLWDMYPEYTNGAGLVKRAFIAAAFHKLRQWDQVSAQRIDHYLANSRFVANRIRKYYRRDSTVIHPPVDIEICSSDTPRENWYLWVGQLVPYKRLDIVIQAFNASGRRLVVIGDGSSLRSVKKTAKSNIVFMGHQSSDVIHDHYSRCKALVFPGIEDFGMVPVEAMASGAPVIACGAGGALETVTEGVSGLFFQNQTPASLNDAIDRFESSKHEFDPSVIRRTTERFRPDRFKSEVQQFIREAMDSAR